MIHVQTWESGCSGRITDMTNAGKRGKRCRVIRFANRGDTATCSIFYEIKALPLSLSFDTAAEMLREMVARVDGVTLDEELIRGIDAPVTPLSAGVAGKWAGHADQTGISLSALDDINEWREVTIRQTGPAAYAIARKVWERVKTAATVYEAGRILREAGASLHGYCGMD